MKFNLTKFALKRQKQIFVASIIMASLWIVYALIFATPFYGLSFFAIEGSILYAKGSEIFYDIQPFNKALLNFSLVSIVLCVITFVYFSHKRRIYYITNYISIGLYAAFSLFLSTYSLVSVISIAIQYGNINFDTVNMIGNLVGRPYSPSYYIFVIGVILSIASMLMVALVGYLTLCKYRERKEELRARNCAKEAENV